jgi:hypothetical protein
MPWLGDDLCGFWDLVWLDTDEQHPQEASAALLDLFRRGYVAVYESKAGIARAEPQVMVDRDAIDAAIRDLSNWESPPADARDRWFSAELTDSGFAKWSADSGPLCDECGRSGPGPAGDPLRVMPLYNWWDRKTPADVGFSHESCMGDDWIGQFYDITEEHLEIWRRLHPVPKPLDRPGGDIAKPS